MTVFDGLSEFKFYQSFRIKVEKADNLRFLLEKYDQVNKADYVQDAQLLDISCTGLGFISKERISMGEEVGISLQFKKMHLDLNGRVVRCFSQSFDDEEIVYGIEIEEEKKLPKFLEYFISSFSVERMRQCIFESALNEPYSAVSDGVETFSLLLSLFKDISYIGSKDGFVDSLLEEVCRVMNAARATIFLINVEKNELEAVSAIGIEKSSLHFDYRMGIAGSVFTTGVALNIDVTKGKSRFNPAFDKKFQYQTKSIICHPIHNREDKIVGVIQVLNKKNQDRFTVEDEKIMKVLSLVFSSVYHNYTPLSEKSIIRRFSTPFDRRDVIIGRAPQITSLRNTIVKLKDLDIPVLIMGEEGVGKTLFSRIIHTEGQRGLNNFEYIECGKKEKEDLKKEIWGREWGSDDEDSKFVKCRRGTLLFREIGKLDLEIQTKLFNILHEKGIPGSKYSLDVRIIATSSTDLGKLTDEGKFHQGLYEVLSQSFVYIEPLRRRIEDIPALVDYFLKKECKEQGLLYKTFSPKVMEKFLDYDWPGNVLELEKAIRRAVLYNPKSHIISEIEIESSSAPVFDVVAKKRLFGDLPYVTDFHIQLKDRVSIVEREMILAEIKRNHGNKSKAAKAMGISREALRKKLLLSEQIIEVLEKETRNKLNTSDLDSSPTEEDQKEEDKKEAA